MNKNIDIKSGSFQLKFKVNGTIVGTQLVLLFVLILGLIFIHTPSVRQLCIAILIMDLLSMAATFFIGATISVSDGDAPAGNTAPAPTPVAQVGERRTSRQSSVRQSSGTINNKVPVPNANAQPPSQSTARQAAPVQQPEPIVSPEPTLNVHEEPSVEMSEPGSRTGERSLESAADEMGLGNKPIEEYSDEDWAKLFGL